YVSRTRVSAVEIWRNDSSDGEVQIAHGINSWPALLEQLNGYKYFDIVINNNIGNEINWK
ncbi:hypothetical protein WUBG_14468, partial [Wuchereria bancrofti]